MTDLNIGPGAENDAATLGLRAAGTTYFQGVGINTSQQSMHFSEFGPTGQPAEHCKSWQIVPPGLGHANRLYAGQAPKLTEFALWSKAAIVGATAYVFRIEDVGGTTQMNLIRTSEVIDARPEVWYQSRGIETTDSEATYDFTNNNRAGSVYSFRLASRDASGQVSSNYSATYKFTPAATGSSSGATNTPYTGTKVSTLGTLAPPTGISIAGHPNDSNAARITFTPDPSAVSTIIEVAFCDADTDVASDGLAYVELENDGGVAILPGDMFYMRRKALNGAECKLWLNSSRGKAKDALRRIAPGPLSDPVNTAYDWSFVAHDGSKPAATLGDYFARLDVPAGDTAALYVAFGAEIYQYFYNTLAPDEVATVDFWIRSSDSYTQPMSVTNVDTGASGSVSVTTSWQRVQHTCSRATWLSVDGLIAFSMDIPGGGSGRTVDLCGFHIRTDRQSFMSLTPDIMLPENGVTREHKSSNRRDAVPDIASSTGIGNDSCVRWTMHATLQNCIAKNNRLWFQAPQFWTASEFADWVAYMNAPNASGHPMADKRLAQGVTDPWSDLLPGKTIIVVDNELWNTAFPSPIPPPDASTGYNRGNYKGLYSDYVRRAMEASPYWDATKFEWHEEGWSGGSFATDAAEYSPIAASLSMAHYVGAGSAYDRPDAPEALDSGEGHSNVLTDVTVSILPRTLQRTAETDALETSQSRTLKRYIYEYNAGFSDPTAAAASADGGTRQAMLGRTRVRAAAVIAAMLEQLENGWELIMWHSLGYGSNFQTHGFNQYTGEFPTLPYGLAVTMHEQFAGSNVFPISKVRDDKITLLNVGDPIEQSSIKVTAFQSTVVPGRWGIVAVNQNLNRSVLETDDPLYDAGDNGARSLTLVPGWATFSSCTAFTAGLGNMREYAWAKSGEKPRLKTEDGFDVDALAIEPDYTGTPVTIANPAAPIAIDERFGATSDGILGGNVLIVVFNGVEEFA